MPSKHKLKSNNMTQVYQCDEFGPLFTSRELVVQSLKLSFHKVAKVVPNAMLTQCTVVFDDTSKANVVHQIKQLEVSNQVEHL